MTDKEFLAWWNKQTFANNTKEQQRAWTAFLRALEAEYKCDVTLVNKIPPHVREPFMAGCILIFQ
jgi:hypothetical protein